MFTWHSLLSTTQSANCCREMLEQAISSCHDPRNLICEWMSFNSVNLFIPDYCPPVRLNCCRTGAQPNMSYMFNDLTPNNRALSSEIGIRFFTRTYRFSNWASVCDWSECLGINVNFEPNDNISFRVFIKFKSAKLRTKFLVTQETQGCIFGFANSFCEFIDRLHSVIFGVFLSRTSQISQVTRQKSLVRCERNIVMFAWTLLFCCYISRRVKSLFCPVWYCRSLAFLCKGFSVIEWEAVILFMK